MSKVRRSDLTHICCSYEAINCLLTTFKYTLYSTGGSANIETYIFLCYTIMSIFRFSLNNGSIFLKSCFELLVFTVF